MTATNYNDWLGHKIEEWRIGFIKISLSLRPNHLNALNIPHGGVLCSLMDISAGLSGLLAPENTQNNKRRALTISLTSQFIRQAPSTGVLTAIGQQLGGGKRLFFASAEIFDQQQQLIAKGDGTFRYLDAS